MNMRFDVPILLLAFNRPNQTNRVFNAIKAVQPSKFYFAADGPREGRTEEAVLCQTVRTSILENIDWDCEVKTLFRDENLGCKYAVSSAISWFFENEPEGIILEDDCLPDPSFFPFCAELLEKYRHDDRIMMISGDNYQKEKLRSDYSYYFTRYNQIWGWASWRRVWDLYDVEMTLLPEILKKGYLNDIFKDKVAAQKWEKTFKQVQSGNQDTWDYQFTFACFIHAGLCINPSANLVSNIGFDTDATHTSAAAHQWANMPTVPVQFPLRHPPYMIRDEKADYFDEKNAFHPKLSVRIKNKIREILA